MIDLSCVISGLDNKLVFCQSVLFGFANEITVTLDLACVGTLLFYCVF